MREERKGYWHPTDLERFRFLRVRQRRGEGAEEVNFWKPGGRGIQKLGRGDVLFLELKAPISAVGGFGFFERFETLPLAVAWDAFGEDNGAPDLPTLDRQIRSYRDPAATEQLPLYEIGCIMLSGVVFFDDRDFVRRSSEWKIQGAVIGAEVALDQPEGKRVWDECRQRAVAEGWSLPGTHEGRVAEGPRTGTPRLVAPRRGQKIFQAAGIAAYGRACAISGEHALPALDAAHIRPFAQEGSHETSNGLLLRSDIHKLFDRGLVTVTPDYSFRVSSRLRDRFRNGRTDYEMERQIAEAGGIRVPQHAADRPERALLQWHSEEMFIA